MAVRADRIEARVAPDKASRIRRAARCLDMSVSAFMVDAASKRADQLLASQAETVVPATYFDDLFAALDTPDVPPPALANAAERARTLVQPR